MLLQLGEHACLKKGAYASPHSNEAALCIRGVQSPCAQLREAPCILCKQCTSRTQSFVSPQNAIPSGSKRRLCIPTTPASLATHAHSARAERTRRAHAQSTLY